jgi:hypothetical protein
MIKDEKPGLAFTTARTFATIVLNSSNTLFPCISSVIVGSFVPRFLVLLVASDTDVSLVRHNPGVPIFIVEECVADSAAVVGR